MTHEPRLGRRPEQIVHGDRFGGAYEPWLPVHGLIAGSTRHMAEKAGWSCCRFCRRHLLTALDLHVCALEPINAKD